jgi:sugar-specific transcriptional regulator TrmB
MSITAAEALASLGFTGLESEIYAFLLREAPVTGYRIAQAIGKPVANTYKAIQSLEAKGAITVDEAASRRCSPLPVEDLLGRLAREFEGRKTAAHEALVNLKSRREGDRLFTLRSREAVVDQAKDLLGTTEKRALLTCSGGFLAELGDAVKGAGRRGVEVEVRSDGLVAGIESSLLEANELFARWPGDGLILVADGEQHVVALIDRWGTIVQAIWGRSRFLSLVLHEGLAAGACLTEVRAKLEEGAGPKRIARALGSYRPAAEEAGFVRLGEELL